MASFCVSLLSETDPCAVAAIKNLTINKGSSYQIKFLLSQNGDDVDLSSYSCRGTIKTSQNSNDILLNMSIANLLLKIDTDNSSIIMNLPESFTTNIQQSIAVYSIDLLSSSSEATKIVSGTITFI